MLKNPGKHWLTERNNMWVIAIGFIFIFVAWVSWCVQQSISLDKRLKSGDVRLLSSSAYHISEVIRAPLGSRVELSTSIPMPTQQLVPVRLANGEIVLLPLSQIIQRPQQ